MFSFLLRGQKRKDLQHDSGQDNSSAHKNMLLNKMTVPGSVCCYLFSFVLKVPLFLAGSKENKSKNKLCVLCAWFIVVKDPFRVTIQATLFRGGG